MNDTTMLYENSIYSYVKTIQNCYPLSGHAANIFAVKRFYEGMFKHGVVVNINNNKLDYICDGILLCSLSAYAQIGGAHYFYDIHQKNKIDGEGIPYEYANLIYRPDFSLIMEDCARHDIYFQSL